MSDFKIKVSVELDDKNLKNQLEKIGEDVELKINTEKVESQLKSLKKTFKDTFKLDGQVINDLNKISKALSNFNKGTTNGINKPLEKTKKEVTNLAKEYKNLASAYDKLQKQMNSGKLGEDSFKRTAMQMSELKTKMGQLFDKMDSRSKEQIRLFDESKTNKQMVEMNSLMSKIETQATSLMTKVNGISFDNIDSSKLKKIKNEIEEIQSVAREDIDLDLNTGELLGDLNKLQSEIKNLEKVEGLYQEFNKISDAIREAGGDTENFTNELRQLENIASSLDGSFDRAFKGANNELKEMRDNLRHVNSEARNVSDSSGFMNDFMGNFTQFKLADIAFDALIDGLRMAVQGIKETVVETDGALTDLRKVYEDFGSLDIGGYLDQVTEVAKASGKASVDVIQGTAKGIQMGIKDINEALEFAKQSAIFSNVGDVSQDVADSTLSAIMSSFGGVENSLKPVREQIKGAGADYNTLTKFMDLANYAGNKFAVSTADVGEALKRSSSALQANGVSMEQSVAMATAMNEVLQDAGRAGTSLKSLSASLTGVQVSARDGSIELTKAGKALKEYANIEVWNKQTGEIKNMYDVMDELAVKWNDLSEVQRTALGTAIAGKTQLNSFNALLQNWDTAKRYVKEYKEGLTVGSAERENAEYIDSIAGKWNEVKENMKSVANELVSGNMAKGFLDGLVSITEGLDKAVALANDSMTHLFEGTADKVISDNIFASLEKGFGGFSDEVNKIVGTFSDAVGGISEFVTELLMIPPGMKPIVNILKEMKNEAKMDEQIAQRESHIKALTTEINTLQNQKQAISEIAKEYDTLNEKTNRTAEENRKLLELKEKLVQIDGDLVLGYDQNGNAILKNLQLQTAEYERQIKLKEQARRVEENSLANDIMQKRIEQQKEYNKALLEYHEMTVATETKRKQSAFGDETLQEYAQRIIESNKKITESNAEAYEKRLADHVQYINDEKALQERYINQMENNDAFIKMAENQKQSILQVMDTIDWSKFSFGEGSQFTQELSKMGDKIVETTEKMGAQAQAINNLENAYASNKAGLIEYTKGLGEQYEIAKKLDAESFTNWKANLQSFVDTTGDLQTANKAIEEMAQSLHEVTGIDVSTWKEALTFDPAPIDAGSQALQRFLQTYGESVNNLNTSDLAQKLASQFEAVQSTYQQMVQDLASGQEIDVEYLINANINQPEPISKLIEKIVADEKVEPQEIDILLQAQAEIINSGTLSNETVKEIAEAFNMSEKEVRAQFNVKAEVKKTDTSELEETVRGWDKIEAKEKILKLVEMIIGEEKFKIAMKIWDLIFPSEEKEQTLKQEVEGDSKIKQAVDWFLGLFKKDEKEQTVKQEVEGDSKVKQAVDWFLGLFKKDEKEQTVKQKAEGDGKIKQAVDWFLGLFKKDEKEQTVKQKAEGDGKVKQAVDWFLGLFKKDEKTQTIKQEEKGHSILRKIVEWFLGLFKKDEKTQTIKQEVKGDSLVKKAIEWFKGLGKKDEKTQTVKQEVKGDNLVKKAIEWFKGLGKKDEKEQTVKQEVKGDNIVKKVVEWFKGLVNKEEKTQTVKQEVKGDSLVKKAIEWFKGLFNKEEKTQTVKQEVKGDSLVKKAIDWFKGLGNKEEKTQTVKQEVKGDSLVKKAIDWFKGLFNKEEKTQTVKQEVKGDSLVKKAIDWFKGLGNKDEKTQTVKQEVKGDGIIKKVVEWFKGLVNKDEKEQVVKQKAEGDGIVKKVVEWFKGLGKKEEKEQVVKQKAEGDGIVKKAVEWFKGLGKKEEKEQVVKQELKLSDLLKKAVEWFKGLVNKEEKTQTVKQESEGSEKTKQDVSWFKQLMQSEEKLQFIKQSIEGNEKLKIAVEWFKGLFKKDEKEQVVKQKAEGDGIVKKVVEWFKGLGNKEEKEQVVKQKAEGDGIVKKVVEWFKALGNKEEKTQTVKQKVEGDSALKQAVDWFLGLFKKDEKEQVVKQKEEGNSALKQVVDWFLGLLKSDEKEQTVKQKAEGDSKVKQAVDWFLGLLKSDEKEQTVKQKAEGDSALKQAVDWFKGLFKKEEKTQTLKQKAEGGEEVKKASDAVEKLPSKKEVFISFVQSGGKLLEGIGNFFDSLGKKNKAKVEAEISSVDASKLKDIKIKVKAEIEKVDTSSLDAISDKTIMLKIDSSNATSKVENIQSILSNIQDKTINLKIDSSNATSKVENIQSILSNMQDKTIMLKIDSSNATSKVENIQSILSNIADKTIKLLIDSSNATSKVENIQSILSNIADKTIKLLIDSSNATSKVENINSLLANIQDKTIKLLIDSSNATSKIENINSLLANIQDKTIKLLADSSNAISKIENVNSQLASIQDKTVKILADSSNAISKIENVNSQLASITDKTVKILADSSNAISKIDNVNSQLASITDKTVKILADSSNAISKIENVKAQLLAIQDKTVKILADSSNAIAKIENVKAQLASIADETVKILADSSNAITKIDNVKAQLASIPDKTVKILADSSNAIAKIDNVKAQLASIPDKTAKILADSSNALAKIDNVKAQLASIQDKTAKILADSSNAIAKIDNVKAQLASIPDKTVKILADSSNAIAKIDNVKAQLASIPDKTAKILADSSNALAKIDNVKAQLASIPDKTVKILADSSNAISKINNVKAQLASIPDKTIKILADSSNAIAKINNVKGALAGLSSKTISLNVNKTVTTTTQTAVNAGASATSSSSNVSLANIPMTSSDTVGESNSMMTAPIVTASASPSTMSISKILPSLNFDIDIFKTLDEALKKVESQLGLVEVQMQKAFGREKIQLLLQQIPLLKEQQNIQEKIIQREREANSQLTSWLQSQGFKFDKLGNITNYIDKLLAMETNVENLKKKYDNLNDAKKKNESATKSAQKAYDGASEALNKTKKYLEEYFSTNNDEINGATEKWWEYENQIKDVEKAIRDAINLPLNNKINEISDQIDFLDAKTGVLSDNKKPTYLIEQNALYKEQQELLHQLAEQMRGQLATLDKNSEEYVELQSEIVGLSTKWWELEGAIRDTNEALEELNRKNKLTPLENSLQETEYLLDRHSDRLALIDAQYKNATGTERVEYLNRRYGILNEQLQATEQSFKRIKQLQWAMIPNLKSFGFTIDENGLIGNYDEILNRLVGKDNYEQAKEYADEYMELVRGDLIDIQVEAFETQKALEDIAKETYEAFEEAREEALEPYRNSLQEIEYLLDRHSDRINLIDAQYANSAGAEKIEYLNRKYGILNEQLLATEQSFNRIKQLQWAMIPNLNSFGFTIDENGLIGNYDEILNNLVGNDNYESAKKYADEYMELVRGDLIDIQVEAFETKNALKETTDEIERLTREHQLFAGDLKLTLLNQEYEELSNNLDIISNKMEYAYGTDKLNLIRQSIEDLNKQLDIQKERIETTSRQMSIYQDNLRNYGFAFDVNGVITNYEKIMKHYQDTEDIEKLTDLTEEYFNLQAEELPDLIGGYSNLEKEIKDVYTEQLNTTQKMESELTGIIKEEYEKRKKEAEDYAEQYANTRIKMLEEEKKAYQEMRDAQNYDNSVEDHLKEIEALRKQIETAKRDTSISGQKRLSELTKELAEAEKRLADLTQDQIDKSYESNIDNEIDKIGEEKTQILDNITKEFDEKLSDENIAKIVQQALTSGFIELNGKIQTVQDLLINSINNSAEGYSAMASVIKNELVANLNIALDTMRELENVNSALGLQNFDVANSVSTSSIKVPEYSGGNGNNVTIGDTHITITGSVDDITLGKIEELIKESQDDMLMRITKNL